MEFVNFLLTYIKLAQFTDIIDVGIVASILYFILKRIKGTSAERSIKGVALLLLITLLSSILNLNTINYILENLTQVGLVAVVVVFQPELRKILERMGKTKFYRHNSGDENSAGEIFINEIVTACERMSEAREGALIVFEREDSLEDIIESGVIVNAKISTELVRNIFYPKAPLHDGAMIVRNGRIAAAACILPLSNNHNISTDLGTRHRAAVGTTELNDAICVVVSEETGAISVSSKGMLKRHLTKNILQKLLRYELLSEQENVLNQGIVAKIINYIKVNINKQKASKED
ncbi:MAG: diadenylate cyclase CdaA [Clostridia bacterium]